MHLESYYITSRLHCPSFCFCYGIPSLFQHRFSVYLLPMELYVLPRPPHLFFLPRLLHPLSPLLFFLILTTCCTSLFPCSLCFDTQYEYCENSSKCGTMDIDYPFGVGNRGCGLPSLQIDCLPDSTLVIEIQHQNYTILDLDVPPDPFHHPDFPQPDRPFPDPRHPNPDMRHPPPPHSRVFAIARGENCTFLDDRNDSQMQSPEKGDTVFRLANETWTLNVYKCNKQPQLKDPGMRPWGCNTTVYYSLLDNETSIPGCSKGQVTVDVVLMKVMVSNDTDESCKSCELSGGICGYNTSDSTPRNSDLDSTAAAPLVCYCKDGPRTDKCHGRHRNKSAIIVGCSVGGAALIAVLLLAYYLKNRKPPTGDLPGHLLGLEMSNLPIFSYQALRQSTNCFHEKNELGFGGFGSVYLGKLWDGRTVAIKRLYQDNSRRLEQFINEVKIFSILNHPHVVRLYGCTPADSPELLLVYEFVPNGTLAGHLHGDRKNPNGIPWNTRLKIAIQTAQALAFLHDLDPPIFHRDVKSSNILLDENLDVKLADFGLCRHVPIDASHVTTIPQGTPGYVDPEYYQCYQLTDKSDVYSFGVVLMEIISAKTAMDINRNRREINLANLAITKIQAGALNELVDPQLQIEVNHEGRAMVSAVAELAFRCLASERDDRPCMKEVVGKLEEIGTSNGPGEQQLRLFSSIKQPNTAALSPISVQDRWPSTSSTWLSTSSASNISA